jgi:CubicO group peptidase (beta-lactamase class C family)
MLSIELSSVPGGPPAQGDAELVALLTPLAGGRATRLAAAVIDLGADPTARLAFVGADGSSLFEIGSVTKALTGMLLADAVERGEIALDTEVRELVPTSAGTEFGSITMKELCTHTSGLPRMPSGPGTFLRALGYAVLGLNPNGGITPSTVLRQAARERLVQRGVRRYSNLGGAVLGQLLAIRSATEFPALLRARILLPVGMTSSAVARRGHAAPPGRSASGLPRRPWISSGYAASGGVVATMADMARLAEALLEGSAPGLASMDPFDDVDTDHPRRRIGMFWTVDSVAGSDHTMVWHNGRTGGYSALFAVFPRAGRAVIVLENASRRPERQQRVVSGLLQALYPSGVGGVGGVGGVDGDEDGDGDGSPTAERT